MNRVRAAWHRWLTTREIDRIEHARQSMNEAWEKHETWGKLFEIRRDHYERLSQTRVLPRKVS